MFFMQNCGNTEITLPRNTVVGFIENTKNPVLKEFILFRYKSQKLEIDPLNLYSCITSPQTEEVRWREKHLQPRTVEENLATLQTCMYEDSRLPRQQKQSEEYP